MTTEPGVLPKDCETLHFEKLPEGLQKMIKNIALRMIKLQQEIRHENQALKDKVDQAEALDEDQQENKNKSSEKTEMELKVLRAVYEDQLSDDENVIGRLPQRGFEKQIDYLLRLQLQQSKKYEQEENKLEDKEKTPEQIEREKIKKQFDRRIYDLDTFKSILCKVDDFDYRYASNKYDDFEKS